MIQGLRPLVSASRRKLRILNTSVDPHNNVVVDRIVSAFKKVEKKVFCSNIDVACIDSSQIVSSETYLRKMQQRTPQFHRKNWSA